MTSTVIPFHNDAIATDAKAEFLRHLSASFDEYVSKWGQEPEAHIFTWCGVSQDCTTGWLMRGASEGAATTVLALAHVSLLKSIINPEYS